MRVEMVLSELDEVQQIYEGAKRAEDYGVDIGITGLAPMGLNWWLVKSGTPEDRVAKLREAMGQALADPEVRERILQIGFVPTDYAPEQFTAVCNDVRDQLTGAMDAITWEKEALAELD